MPHRSRSQKTLNAWRSAKAAVAVTVIAAAIPALAQAHFAPGDLVTQQPQTRYSSVRLNQLDEIGPKYVTIHRPSSATTTPNSGSPSGFDWRDTGAGFGSAAFALALLALIRRHRRGTQPEQGTLAGA